jgi:signal transduction histidine kinase
MHSIKSVIKYLNQSIQRSMSDSAHLSVAVGAISFLGFPLFYWISTLWFPQPYENFWLRAIGSILGLGLIVTSYWPILSKRYLPWYWFMTILYVLPFFFTYYFLMNQASDVSAMALLCSVFLLVLLLDLYTLSVMLILGLSLGFLYYYHTSPQVYFSTEHVEMVWILLFVIVAGSILNYKTALYQRQRMAGMAAAAGMIAHELRTPLLGIKSGAQALSAYLPLLFEAYTLAKDHGLITSSIRGNRVRHLAGISERIISEIDYANTIIDMLLIKAGRENYLQNCTLEQCSMAECLEEAITRYPFQSTQSSSLIRWQGDFKFMGSKLLMQHVLFNLFKNALYVIAKNQRGEITIWTEARHHYNYLFVQDTAKGISPRQLSRLFEHFYTTTFMGTGIGLSFCKLVMNRFGGDISCESIEGEYTKFILKFPILRAHQQTIVEAVKEEEVLSEGV